MFQQESSLQLVSALCVDTFKESADGVIHY